MRVVLSLVVIAVLAACSGHSNASTASSSPNPITFPLYDGSNVVVQRAFTVTVDRANLQTYAAIFPSGVGTYADREIIAQNAATFDDLSRWIVQISVNPPAGYVLAGDQDALKGAQGQVVGDGLAFAVFHPQDDPQNGEVLVTVVDPVVVRARVGMAMGLIDNYRSLPAVLRDATDARMKKEYGMTVSELIDPAMPLGQALAAYDAVKDSGERAIVVVDARKQ